LSTKRTFSIRQNGTNYSGYSVITDITLNLKKMGIKPGPKRKAKSTGKPDRRQRDNKNTPGNTPSLKPSKSTKKKK